MRVLILANTSKLHKINGKCIPTCFLPLHGGITILQRTFSLLSVSGFSPDEIGVCFGTGGVWGSSDAIEYINQMHVKKFYSSGSDSLEQSVLADEFFKDEDLLLIDGSFVIDLAIITRLLRYKEKNVIVVKDSLSPDDAAQLIVSSNDIVCDVVTPDVATYPWVGYAGICKLTKDVVEDLIPKLSLKYSLLTALGLLLDIHVLKTVNYDDLGYGIIRKGQSNELIGGSYSKLNYRLVVRKEAEGNGRDKLVNEIEWLLQIPEKLKPYFSCVLEYDIVSPKVYYNVPYYGSRNLREYIFAGNFNEEDTLSFLDKLLRWMFENVYCHKISKADKDWTREKHINRVLDRLDECCEESHDLKRIIEAKTIWINGKEYRNVREIYKKILTMNCFIGTINPNDLVMIHGDLHFQNILLSSENDMGFILVDPRGEKKGSDIYYDMGKIFHSLHGKYDFIHSDQFRLRVVYDNGIPHAEYYFTNEYMVSIYEKIYDKFLNRLGRFDYMKNDPYWKMKCLWAEASHFCSVMTFHISKSSTSDRVIMLYLTGVMLINEFYENYLIDERWKTLQVGH